MRPPPHRHRRPMPPLDDILDCLHVVSVAERVEFRDTTVRELALADGPAGCANHCDLTSPDQTGCLLDL